MGVVSAGTIDDQSSALAGMRCVGRDCAREHITVERRAQITMCLPQPGQWCLLPGLLAVL